MIDVMKVGRNIQFLRKSSSFTQQELASKINVSHQAVSKWERGESLPEIDSMVHLSKLFNVSLDDLIDRDLTTYPHETIIDEGNVSVIWDHVLSVMRTKVNRPSYDTWLKNTEARVEHDSVIVISPNECSTDWLRTRYKRPIREAICQLVPGYSGEIIFRSST